jgi:hypothetical protein
MTRCITQTPGSDSASVLALSMQCAEPNNTLKALALENQASMSEAQCGQLSAFPPQSSERIRNYGVPRLLAVGSSLPFTSCKASLHRYAFPLRALICCGKCLTFEWNCFRCLDDETRDCTLWAIHRVIESELDSSARENDVQSLTRSRTEKRGIPG